MSTLLTAAVQLAWVRSVVRGSSGSEKL